MIVAEFWEPLKLHSHAPKWITGYDGPLDRAVLAENSRSKSDEGPLPYLKAERG